MPFDLKTSILLSFLFHGIGLVVLFLGNLSESPLTPPRIQPFPGSNIQYFAKIRSKGNTNYSEDSNPPSQNQEKGSQVQDEVHRFKKELHYPPSALERGLESDCEWIVKVAEKGKVEKVENVRECRYKIFDSEFRNKVMNWEFSLPPGSTIRIPVRFRIQKNEQ